MPVPLRKSSFSSVSHPILTALALVALAIVLWRLSDVVLIAFGGVVVATLLRAFAEPLMRFQVLSTRLRLTTALVALLCLFGALVWTFGHQVAAQAGELRRLLPEQTGRVMAWLQQYDFGREGMSSFRKWGEDSKTMGGLGTAAAAILGGTWDAILIGFLGVYFAFDPELYIGGFLRLLPIERRPKVRRALDHAGIALRRWLLAQLIAMTAVGILAGLGLALIGVPLALVLGALAALLEFIPVIGPIIFGVPAVLVAFSRGPRTALYALLIYTAIQQLESNLIVPLLQRWAVRMPPVIGLLAVLAAAILLGPIGIIFAAPLAVVTIALVKHLYVEDTLEQPQPGRVT
jgi:predicted PurR-regulated permease PerM